MRLHQVIALEKARKPAAKKAGDAIYHMLQKTHLANGTYGVYTPATDSEARLTPEVQLIQADAAKLLAGYAESQAPAWDMTATKENANTTARADVKLPDGTVLLPDVPVTVLIFLEKQLTDLATVVGAAPVLDPAEEWQFNNETGIWETRPVTTERTRKVTEPVVIIPPTDRHPGQWTDRSRDIKAGTWSRTKMSAALPATRKEELLRRVAVLTEAVKTAREEANTAETAEVKIAAPLFTWLLR